MSPGPETCKDMVKIVHVTLVVQPNFMKLQSFLCAKKTKKKDFIQQFFPPASPSSAIIESIMTHVNPAVDVEHKYAASCLQAEESNPHASWNSR